METTQVLYTRNFSGFGALQDAHVLQYALVTASEGELRYGVSVTVLRPGGQDTRLCRAISNTQEGACGLLVFLWENAVGPQAMEDVVADMRHAGILPC